MWFVGEAAEADPRENGTPLQHECAGPEQGRAQEAILAMSGVDEDGREGNDRQRSETGSEIAPNRAPIGAPREAQPREQRPPIGQHRQRQTDQKIDWRIEERGVTDVLTEEL